MRTPEVGPEEERFVVGGDFVEYAIGFFGDKIFDAGFDRPVVQREHLLGLVGRIGADIAVGNVGRRVEATLLEIVGVGVVAVRFGAELQAGQEAGAGKGVAHKILAGESVTRGAGFFVDVPFTGITAAITDFIEIVVDALHVFVDAQAITGDAVFVRVEASVEGSARRRADSGGGERGIETHAAFGQGIYIGRFANVVEAVAADGVETLLVGHQHDDVWALAHY